jgi:tetratricopeptide (TPR) repeat protein
VPQTAPSLLNLALAFLRTARGWTQERLAKAAGTYGRAICDYEAGKRRTLPRETFNRLVALMGYGRDEVDLTLLYVAGLLEAGGAPPETATAISLSPAEERRIRSIAAYLGLLEAGRMRSRLRRLAQSRRAAAARREAVRLCREVIRAGPQRRRQLAETRSELQTWAVAERLCEESARAAAESPPRALDLALLALKVAELAPGGWRWRSCLQGYAQAFVANALRVGSDLPAAEAAFAVAWRLWRAGGVAAQGPLAEWRLLDLEASLRRDLRQFEAALELLRQALASAPAESRGRILLQQGNVLEQAGQIAAALAALEEAAPLLDAAGDRRARMGVRFNRVVILCHLGRFAEATAGLPELCRLVSGSRSDAMRVRWLSGRVAAGLGRRAQARRAFEGVRRYFGEQPDAYNAALVSLDLAILYLAEHRPEKVAALSEEMMRLFASQRVHREALAALRLFVDAVEAGSATAELARRILAFLERAHHDRSLRFEATP